MKPFINLILFFVFAFGFPTWVITKFDLSGGVGFLVWFPSAMVGMGIWYVISKVISGEYD